VVATTTQGDFVHSMTLTLVSGFCRPSQRLGTQLFRISVKLQWRTA